jgi:putative peptide zinc metalloprotease protein
VNHPTPVRERERESTTSTVWSPVRLAPGVVIHPTLAGGADDRVVELPDDRLTRVGADVGRLLDALADLGAAPTAGTLAARLGAPWTPAIVDDTVGRLDELGITGAGDGAAATAPRAPRRIEYRPPMSLQVTLLRPGRLLSAAAPALRTLTGRAGAAIAVLLVAAGVPVLAAALSPASAPLHSPAEVSTYALVILALLITVAIHELAHGAVLAAHGGRPRRMGFMIFYLLPAFFCDVSDAWRLAPRDRVRVALAGIVAQCTLGGIAALASLPAVGSLEQGLIFYALLCYAYGAVNFLPFIKLDGYVALTAGLDIPHLRRKAMADFQAVLAQRLLGARREPRQLEQSWGAWFGAGCALTPAVVLGAAVASLGPAILPLGTVGAVAALLLAALLACLIVRAIGAFTAGALRTGAGRLRTAATLSALALVLATVLAVVQVPRSLHGGYAMVKRSPTLVLGLGAGAADDLRPGTKVRIAHSGLVAGETVATATVTGPARACDAPLESLVPVRDARNTLAAQCLALRLDGSSRPPASGRTTASAPDAPLGARIAEIFITPSLKALGIS